MRDLISVVETYAEPSPDPMQGFSQSALLKQILQADSSATVAMGTKPGEIIVTLGDLTLQAQIIGTL